MAWSMTTNEYRLIIGGLFLALIAILTWLGLGIINGQATIGTELKNGQQTLISLQADVMNIRDEVSETKGQYTMVDDRLTRTNERQTSQGDRLTRLEALLETIKNLPRQ